MKKIYIHSRESKLFHEVVLKHKGKFIFKDCTANTLRLAQKLRLAGWEEIFANVPFDFSSKIREFLSALNVSNAERHWWTLNIADKNPLASLFCNQVLYFHAVINVLVCSCDDTLVVLTNDHNFIEQLRSWVRKSNYVFYNDAQIGFKELFKRITLLGPLYALMRTAFRSMHDKFLFKRNSLLKFKGKNAVVFCPLVSSASFKGDLYRDVYFQPLLDYMKNEGKPYFIFSVILEPYNECAKKLSRSKDHDFTTILYWLKLSDLVVCFFRCIRYCLGRIFWNGNSVFQGQDVSILIRHALKEDYSSTKYFMNDIVYASAKRLFAKLKPERLLCPFEMHPWEKMMITALREENPKAYIVGYQHAAFTQRHLNLRFSEEEACVTPIPDLIVTSGLQVCNILCKVNPFLAERIIPGCALRQSVLSVYNSKISKEKDYFEIFVAMSSNLQEHVKLISMINECSEKLKGNFRFLLSPHPTVNFSLASSMIGGLRKDVSQTVLPLYDMLAKADLVMYASSTVAVEALFFGKPLIFINMGDVLNPDPLFDFPKGRISVSSVDECVLAIESVKQGFMTPEFVVEAQEYVNNYFLPIDNKRLSVFL